MKKILSFTVTLAILLSFVSLSAYASEYKDIHLTKEQLALDASSVIEDALLEAKENASDSLVYRIYVPSGEYNLNSGLHVFSNTQLYLDDDTVFNRSFESGNMLKLGYQGEITEKYSGYRNIVVSGGTWNSRYIGTSCAMRFAHCTNVTVQNLTIKNIENAHHIEFAAADGFNVLNCNFSGMIRTGSSSCEALQIDIIHESEHFPAYDKYDDTPSKNVVVSGCNFSDLYSGIGTRSGVVGSYFDNISIIGNTFTNITEKAITCLNYVNSRISENVINNATSGIIFECYPKGDYADRLYLPNDGSKPKLTDSFNCEISSNSISVNSNIGGVDCCAITVHGAKVDDTRAQVADVVSGSYLASDMSIYKNVIYCNSTNARGVFLSGVKDSEIVGNQIYNNSYSNDGINGINVCDSSYNSFQSNLISGAFNNGISLYDGDSTYAGSKHNSFYSNSVSGVKSYGLRIAADSTATIKYNNSFTNCGKEPILIAGTGVSQNIGEVQVKSIKASGRGRALLRWRALDGADGYKIYRSMTPFGDYRQVATVKGNARLLFEDKSTRPGRTYYYKISPYKSVKSSVVISAPGRENAATV